MSQTKIKVINHKSNKLNKEVPAAKQAKQTKHSQVSKKSKGPKESNEPKVTRSRRYKYIYAICGVFVVLLLIFIVAALMMPAKTTHVPGHQADNVPKELQAELGAVVSSGDNLFLATGYDRELESVTIDYRTIKDVTRFISLSDRPIVLVVREQGQKGSEQITPFAEDLAEQFKDNLYVILIEPDQELDLLTNLDFRYLPATYLWDKGQKALEVIGYDPAKLADFKVELKKYLKA